MSLPRPRLLELIAEALKRPLTLLCAPAGFGKSTLVSGWANEAVDRPAIAWLSLDEDDNDPARFFDYLERALQLAHADEHRVAGPLPGSGPPTAKERMVWLLDDLADVDHPAVLVLDDYHLIRNDEIDAAVSFLVEHLPEHLRVVIATRSAPNLPISRWRARQRMTEIGADQLRFTVDEATAFMVRTMGISVDSSSIRMLADRTEGWVAGLQIAALAAVAGELDMPRSIRVKRTLSPKPWKRTSVWPRVMRASPGLSSHRSLAALIGPPVGCCGN